MVRLSALRNHPVICGGRPLGLLQGISLDEAQRSVAALIVSCGFRGKRVALPEDVESIGNGFILVSQARKYKRSLEQPLCAFVRDTSGALAGRITDYAIDERSLRVTAIELSPGYTPGEWRSRLWMYAYARADGGAGELTVPACLSREPILTREGTEECAYLP